MRVTPEQISTLEDNEIFVFGSNESGIHGAGAARFAYDNFGAFYEQGFGLMGQSFGIPTKDWFITKLNIQQRIVSGTFWYDAINSDGEKVEVRDGRFDMRYVN